MRQNSNYQVGQIRVSKWAMPEYRTHLPPQAAKLCAGHVQQFGGASPLPNLMEVKG